MLLELAHFTERISEAFFTQAAQRTQLSEQLANVKKQLKSSKTERGSLRDALDQSEKVCKEAIETAERSERMLSAEQKESERLNAQFNEASELAARRHDLIARHKDKVSPELAQYRLWELLSCRTSRIFAGNDPTEEDKWAHERRG